MKGHRTTTRKEPGSARQGRGLDLRRLLDDPMCTPPNLLGTHQGAVRPQQLDYYLDEFTFRIDRLYDTAG